MKYLWLILFCLATCKCTEQPNPKPVKPLREFMWFNAKGPFHFWRTTDSLGVKRTLVFQSDGTIFYIRADTLVDSVHIDPEAFGVFRSASSYN
jgi:hypothetical protein